MFQKLNWKVGVHIKMEFLRKTLLFFRAQKNPSSLDTNFLSFALTNLYFVMNKLKLNSFYGDKLSKKIYRIANKNDL